MPRNLTSDAPLDGGRRRRMWLLSSLSKAKPYSCTDREWQELLRSYPRSRPPLPPQYQRIFTEHYRSNRAAQDRLGRVVATLESWMHRRVARLARPGSTILEIGAGTLNHIPYESPAQVYDVVEPFRALWQDSPHRGAVRRIYSDVAEIPNSFRYDRILAIAVLEHLTDLPSILARCGMLLAETGVFQAGIPTEGGMLWGLGWRVTTGVAFRLKRGLNYATIMRHEHLNTAAEIEAVVTHLFQTVTIERFPLWPRHLSFYTYIEARNPKRDRCADLLGGSAAGGGAP